MKKHKVSAAIALGIFLFTTTSVLWIFTPKKGSITNVSTDGALLALIKNDLDAFRTFTNNGGSVHDRLPLIDKQSYTVAQGIAYFERTSFAAHLQKKKISFVQQDQNAPLDIMTLVVKKNLPELFILVSEERPDFDLTYGRKGWSLLHMASAWCSHKILKDLITRTKVTWETRAKDGSTPLTLAAEHECLSVLSYFKESGADFRAKDGRGKNALAILRTKKDAALSAFAASFEARGVAGIKVVNVAKDSGGPNFYKKRKIPKDQIVDHAAMLEPEERPLSATETAENSEFAD